MPGPNDGYQGVPVNMLSMYARRQVTPIFNQLAQDGHMDPVQHNVNGIMTTFAHLDHPDLKESDRPHLHNALHRQLLELSNDIEDGQLIHEQSGYARSSAVSGIRNLAGRIPQEPGTPRMQPRPARHDVSQRRQSVARPINVVDDAEYDSFLRAFNS